VEPVSTSVASPPRCPPSHPYTHNPLPPAPSTNPKHTHTISPLYRQHSRLALGQLDLPIFGFFLWCTKQATFAPPRRRALSEKLMKYSISGFPRGSEVSAGISFIQRASEPHMEPALARRWSDELQCRFQLELPPHLVARSIGIRVLPSFAPADVLMEIWNDRPAKSSEIFHVAKHGAASHVSSRCTCVAKLYPSLHLNVNLE
jgi:hypothetical protein